MSADWNVETLLEPISQENPCGENLEDTFVLTGFDALKIFGQTRSPEAPPDATIEEGGKPRPPIEWDRLREDALEALGRSKDLRPLAYLATALLRTHGLPAFARTLGVAATWLETYWPSLYPSIDEDALERRNALNCFGDLMAVVDRVRRLPVVESRKYGRFSLRDFDMISGQVTPAEGETPPDQASVDAAFADVTTDTLSELDEACSLSLEAVQAIENKMRDEGGIEMVPEFDGLSTQLTKMRRLLQEKLGQRSPGEAGGDGETPAGDTGDEEGGGYRGGAIRSRAEAIRALDAVADYFRRTEPSSPVPLMVDRAKRLVSMDFLEMLAEIAPDAVPSARAAAGLKDY